MAPSYIKVSSLPRGEEKACGMLLLLQEGPVQGEVSHHGSWVTQTNTGKEKKREGGEPDSFTLPGLSLGWGLCRSSWGSVRAPEGANPMGSTETQEQG